MTKLILFMFPGACSRVTMNALEEAGAPFEDRAVNLRSGEQSKASYLAVNRKGKVPALSVDGRLMTENAAILSFLAARYPAAGLLPDDGDLVARHQGLVDLIWCSSTLHPVVRQIRMPSRWTKGETAGVEQDGMEKLAKEAAFLSERLADGRWWYGERWSIVDVYLYWIYSTAAKGAFPIGDYPVLGEHAERVRSRPAFQRALKRELAAVERHALPLDPTTL